MGNGNRTLRGDNKVGQNGRIEISDASALKGARLFPVTNVRDLGLKLDISLDGRNGLTVYVDRTIHTRLLNQGAEAAFTGVFDVELTTQTVMRKGDDGKTREWVEAALVMRSASETDGASPASIVLAGREEATEYRNQGYSIRYGGGLMVVMALQKETA